MGKGLVSISEEQIIWTRVEVEMEADLEQQQFSVEMEAVFCKDGAGFCRDGAGFCRDGSRS